MSSNASELVLANVPKGHPDPATTFKLQPLSSTPDKAYPGHILLRSKIISVDPYLRKEIVDHPHIGRPVQSWGVAEVLDSQLAGFTKGDIVTGILPWRTVQLHDGKQDWAEGAMLRKVTPLPGVPLSAYVGVLGMPGRTAYFGLLHPETGGFKAGQTVVVSGAAGAVGSLVGQLAKLKGAKRVIGTAGGPDKCRLVKEKYGFDECLDYKALDTADKMQAALKAAAPEGVHLYFDNVGGHVTEAMWDLYVRHGRMVLCGSISGYNKDPKEDMIPNPFGLKMIYAALSVRGFLVHDYADQFDEFYAEVPQLVQEGKIQFDETLYNGFDKVPDAFSGLFLGHNTGKAVVIVE